MRFRFLRFAHVLVGRPVPTPGSSARAGFFRDMCQLRGGERMGINASWQRLRSSFSNSVGTIVFGMEDGTVSIFGLIFGVAATTTAKKTVLIAGARGAAAAAVSMMAGAYLDAETTRDEADATRSAMFASTPSGMSVSKHLGRVG